MARTNVALTEITRTGVAATLAAANADGHDFANNGNTYIEVANGGAAPIDVTVQTPQQVHGLDVADLVVAVGIGERKKIGPFPPATFNQIGTAAGKVYVNFSGVSSVTFGVFKL